MWQAFSIRIFMNSNATTSSRISTPTVSKAGRPALNRSSITHWVKVSPIAGNASSMPLRAFSRSREAADTCGAIRSTMLLGKAVRPSIQLASSGSRPRAKETTAKRAVSPLWRRLSQDITVKGARPDSRRRRKASTMKPKAVRGGAPVRSKATSGVSRRNAPVTSSIL